MYVHTRGHLFPRNPLRPSAPTATSLSQESLREAESFLCLTLQERSPPSPYLLCLLSRCARTSQGFYLAVRVYPGYKTAEEEERSGPKRRRGRGPPGVVSSASAIAKRIYERGSRSSSTRERAPAEKKREEFRGTCSVIIAEVATPASLTARSTAK